MTFTHYLKEQLTDFVESYRKYLLPTFGTTLKNTVLCFILSAILFHFSEFDKANTTKQISLLSYYFNRYSKAETYSIIDLTKSVFLFFVSVFSVGLIRLEQPKKNKISFKQNTSHVHFKDLTYLFATLIAVSFLDYAFFSIDGISNARVQNLPLAKYFHDSLFHLRIYIPLFFFSITIRSLVSTDTARLTFKRVLLLYISLWLFNEIAYEMSLWVRTHLFALLLIPFSGSDKYYLYESILGIPLIAFYFPGYYSAMTYYFKQNNLCISAEK
jgi:hypothetical protein